MAKIYVIAGNRREFDFWCHENLVSPHSPLVVYIGEGDGRQKLYGLKNPEVVCYGTFHSRKDYHELSEIVGERCRTPQPQVIIREVEVKVYPKPVRFAHVGPRMVDWD